MRINPRQIEVLDEDVARVLREKTGAERLRVSSGMFAAARRMLLSHLATEHPDWDERRVHEEVARRLTLGSG